MTMLGKKGLASRMYITLQLLVHNLEGINSHNKRQEIEAYAAKKNVVFTETQHEHCSEEGGQECTWKVKPPGGNTVASQFMSRPQRR